MSNTPTENASHRVTGILEAVVAAHNRVSMKPILNAWGKATFGLFVAYLAVMEYAYIRFPDEAGNGTGTILADPSVMATLPEVYAMLAVSVGIAAAMVYSVKLLVHDLSRGGDCEVREE